MKKGGMKTLLLSFKNRLISETFFQYFSERLGPSWEIHLKPEPGRNYEVIVFDKASLKELSSEAYPGAHKLLLDDGASEQETIFLFLYYRLSGVLSCDTTPENFIKALEVVLKGEVWLSRCLVKRLCEDYGSLSFKDLPVLTPKEREIVALICNGLSNEEIAKNLNLSCNTVKSHLNRIFKKAGVKSRGELIRLFLNAFKPQNTFSHPGKERKSEPKKKTVLKKRKDSEEDT